MKFLKYLTIALALLSKDCFGYINLRPEHQIVRVGGEAKFVCESDITKYIVNWMSSPNPVDIPFGVIYNGVERPSHQNKYIVTQVVEDYKRRSNLTIMNIGFEDSGVIFCSDKGGFGTPQEANLTVADGIDCSSACVNDQFLVTCSSCYWMGRQTSNDEHHPALNHFLQISESDEYIPSNTSTESYDSNKNCNQMKSIWALNVSCKAFDKHDPIKPVVLLSSDLTNVRKVNLASEAIHVLVDRMIEVTTTSGDDVDKINVQDEENINRKSLMIGMAIGFSTTIILTILVWCCCRVKRYHKNMSRSSAKDYSTERQCLQRDDVERKAGLLNLAKA